LEEREAERLAQAHLRARRSAVPLARVLAQMEQLVKSLEPQMV